MHATLTFTSNWILGLKICGRCCFNRVMSESKIPKKNQFSSQYFAKFGFCQMVSQFHLGNMLIFGIVHFPIVSQFATKVHTQTTTTSVMRQQQHQIRNGSVRGFRTQAVWRASKGAKCFVFTPPDHLYQCDDRKNESNRTCYCWTHGKYTALVCLHTALQENAQNTFAAIALKTGVKRQMWSNSYSAFGILGDNLTRMTFPNIPPQLKIGIFGNWRIFFGKSRILTSP